jgi:hypothetical protein
MPRGSKPGERRGGRVAGTPNKKSAAIIAAAKASGLLPHEFLLAVSRGEAVGDHFPTFEERLDAAKAAAPYYAPKLSTIDASLTGRDGGPIQHSISVAFVDPDDAG